MNFCHKQLLFCNDLSPSWQSIPLRVKKTFDRQAFSSILKFFFLKALFLHDPWCWCPLPLPCLWFCVCRCGLCCESSKFFWLEEKGFAWCLWVDSSQTLQPPLEASREHTTPLSKFLSFSLSKMHRVGFREKIPWMVEWSFLRLYWFSVSPDHLRSRWREWNWLDSPLRQCCKFNGGKTKVGTLLWNRTSHFNSRFVEIFSSSFLLIFGADKTIGANIIYKPALKEAFVGNQIVTSCEMYRGFSRDHDKPIGLDFSVAILNSFSHSFIKVRRKSKSIVFGWYFWMNFWWKLFQASMRHVIPRRSRCLRPHFICVPFIKKIIGMCSSFKIFLLSNKISLLQ